MAETPRELGTERYSGTPWSDDSCEPDERGYSERYCLGGIECQVGHMSVGAFEREITRLVVDHEFTEELLKIMSGLFEGLPLVGEDLMRWRWKAAYTEELQRTTIKNKPSLTGSGYDTERVFPLFGLPAGSRHSAQALDSSPCEIAGPVLHVSAPVAALCWRRCATAPEA